MFRLELNGWLVNAYNSLGTVELPENRALI